MNLLNHPGALIVEPDGFPLKTTKYNKQLKKICKKYKINFNYINFNEIGKSMYYEVILRKFHAYDTIIFYLKNNALSFTTDFKIFIFQINDIKIKINLKNEETKFKRLLKTIL